MDSLATLLVVVLVLGVAGFVVYRIARGSGSSTAGITNPGRPTYDPNDPR